MDWLETLDPAFKPLVLRNAPLLTLGEGFAWLEGPVWCADANQLLVSDIPNNRILRWTEESGVSVFRQPSAFANGHTRDRQGRLIGCSHQHRCITRTELDGSITILAESYNGKRLNSPNDVVAHSDGAIWFTIVADDFAGPNGLCFSPDEKLLYIAETGPQFETLPAPHIRVFDVADGKKLSRGRTFHKVSPGVADGFRCDEDGRLWTSAGDGVHCLSPDGTLLGKILTGGTVANLTFGGRNRSRLFICAGQKLMAVYTNVRGAQRP
jgi:gluconolactonase